MANDVIVASFDNQNAAYEAAGDIQNLENGGTVTIRRGAIVTKDMRGNLTILNSRQVGGAWGLLGGGVIGALLGLLIGPAGAAGGAVAGGAVAGASIGALGSAMSDAMRLGLGRQFLEDVGSKIEPGQTVLLAELDEGAPEAVDSAVTRRGGQVFRSTT